MLDIMRKHAGSWGIKALLIAVASSFFIGFGLLTVFKKGVVGGGDDVVAEINGQNIYTVDLLRATARYREIFKDSYRDSFHKRMALDSLMLRQIVLDEARKVGIRVTEEELTSSISRYPAFQDENGRFSRQRYLRALQYSRMYPGDFENSQREEIIVQKFADIMMKSALVTDADLWDEFVRDNEKVSLLFAEVDPVKTVVRVRITDTEAKQYFSMSQEEFKVPQKRKAEYAMFDPETYSSRIAVSPGEDRDYYTKNRAKYTHKDKVKASHILIKSLKTEDKAKHEAARKKAGELARKLKAGANFEELARKNSDDPGSAKKGGDLGFFEKGMMVKEFEKAAFSQKEGEIGEPVETQFGFHIIKVIEKKQAGQDSFEKVREEIQAALKAVKAKARVEEDARAMDLALKAGKTLKDAAAQLKMTLNETVYFGKEDFITGFEDPAAFAKEAFALSEGGTSGPVKVGNTWVLLKVTGIKAERIPDFSEVKTAVQDKLKEKRAREEALSVAAEISSDVNKGRDLRAAAAKFGIKAESTGLFSRADAAVPNIGASEEILSAAFALTEKAPVNRGPVQFSNKYYMLKLEKRIPANKLAFEAEKESLRAKLSKTLGNEIEQRFFKSLRDGAKITINEAALKSTSPMAPEE
jgi:peptidyl-prolyl cis-trans isomerase D